MNKLWKEDKRKNAEKIISEILPHVHGMGVAYHPIINIALRELGASASNSLKENLIIDTLVKVKSENQSSVDLRISICGKL